MTHLHYYQQQQVPVRTHPKRSGPSKASQAIHCRFAAKAVKCITGRALGIKCGVLSVCVGSEWFICVLEVPGGICQNSGHKGKSALIFTHSNPVFKFNWSAFQVALEQKIVVVP